MQNNTSSNRTFTEQSLNQKYGSARFNLLLVVLFSAINLLLLVTKSSTYFLFSASIPYMLTDLGMFLCGMYPADYYTGELEGFQALPSVVFYVMLAISIVILLLYLVSYLLSKRRVGWLIFSLVFFALDTVGMFLYFGIALDMIIDIAFHIWVIVILVQGIRAHYQLKNLPPEPQIEEPVTENTDAE